MAAASLGAGASLNGAVPFPADNVWNTRIDTAPVDPNSANLIASIGLTTGLHPDFGAGYYAHQIIGIPYVVVSSAQAGVAIKFTLYGDQSDPGPYPVPANAPVEGSKNNGKPPAGDRHVLVIDRDTNRLYEMYQSVLQTNGSWDAGSGAVFHLDSDDVRPTAQPGWTSADAAGLPIFPGLVRYDEAAAGVIAHALRFTVNNVRAAWVAPANHLVGTNISTNLPPMGMRVRLKASYQIPSTFSGVSQAILKAMQTYGMFVADIGSNWYISGAPNAHWNNSRLNAELGTVKGADFEVVQMGPIQTE